MRWKTTILAVVGAACVATACGQPGDGGDAGDAAGGAADATRESAPPSVPSTEHAPTDAPAPEDGGRTVPASRLDATALPKGYPTEVLADGRVLTITGQEGGCSEAGAELVEGDTERVVVRMVETKPAGNGLACTMDMRYPPLEVTLEQPLRDRLVELRYVERRA